MQIFFTVYAVSFSAVSYYSIENSFPSYVPLDLKYNSADLGNLDTASFMQPIFTG
jgi:hypothetical protein